MNPRLITLTTDFGHKDPFVGTMKGVICGINPNARIIDLTHGLPAQDILAGALALRASVCYFPHGTIHVAVVDPGVGSSRRSLLIESEDYFFIGPDNGIFTLALEGKKTKQAIELANQCYRLQPTSSTFHGRDIFAPAAGYLSLGIPPRDFGPPVQDYTTLHWPKPSRTGGAIHGEIIYIDGFGNLVTNIQEHDLNGLRSESVVVCLGDLTIDGIAATYLCGEKQGYVALINSWGLLEISLYKESAQRRSGAKIGDRVQIELKEAIQKKAQ